MVGSLAVCLACWLDDWCFDKLVGFLVDWLVFGWLVDLLVGWLVLLISWIPWLFGWSSDKLVDW